MADKTPPKADAPKEEHRKFAEEFLKDEKYKQKPAGFKKTDEVKE
jgi:hypothetical protein